LIHTWHARLRHFVADEATHQLGTKEAKQLNLAWLGAMSAQAGAELNSSG
jgi:hypothetical protein